nr:phospholipase-like protein [Tanacetum cinerariifolium]
MSDLYDVKISVRSSVKLLSEIKGLLPMKPNREKLFRDTVFGPWLDIQSHENDSHMMHYAFQHQANVIPRGLAWSKVTMFKKSDYKELFGPMLNPNVALISSPEEMSQSWFNDSAEFIKGLDAQDGTFLQDDQGREKCMEQHNGMCGDTEDDDGDGVLDSQTKDVIEEASMLPTMSSNRPQARNAAVSEFDALKKEVLLIKK